jgi:hypothetical protein
MLLDDPLPGTISLTAQEKVRFTELEAIVETHLETFLTVGRALAEIRSRRLYRQQFATFEDYCVKRWGFGGARGLDLLRSTCVAEHLLAGPAAPGGDAPMPSDLSADTLRPLQRLDAPLQSAVWRLASRVGKPTHHVVAKIVRVVEHAINEGTNGTGNPKPKLPQSQKKIFLLSVHRLADSPWFSAHLAVQGVDEARARKHLEAAQQLISRLHELIGELRREFPEL